MKIFTVYRDWMKKVQEEIQKVRFTSSSYVKPFAVVAVYAVQIYSRVANNVTLKNGRRPILFCYAHVCGPVTKRGSISGI